MMTVKKLLFAQDVFKSNYDASYAGGFNQRVLGDPLSSTFDAWDRGVRGQGWEAAEQLVQAGKIYFVHPFPHNCRDYAFPYGGTWVCNSCGNSGLDKPWWRIRVFKDGSAWCCVGEGFEDLQASDNYAFGDTRDEAIKAYGKLMALTPA